MSEAGDEKSATTTPRITEAGGGEVAAQPAPVVAQHDGPSRSRHAACGAIARGGSRRGSAATATSRHSDASTASPMQQSSGGAGTNGSAKRAARPGIRRKRKADALASDDSHQRTRGASTAGHKTDDSDEAFSQRVEGLQSTLHRAVRHGEYCGQPCTALVFFSRSAHPMARYLSNFTALPRGSGLMIDGLEFPSVEHYFQGMKYQCLTRPASNAKRIPTLADFAVGGKVGAQSAQKARSAGTKGSMTKHGVALDVKKWSGGVETKRGEAFEVGSQSSMSTTVMHVALAARARSDSLFCALLQHARVKKWKLCHFERSGARSIWGGFFAKPPTTSDASEWRGGNRLGELMMALKLPLPEGVSAKRADP